MVGFKNCFRVSSYRLMTFVFRVLLYFVGAAVPTSCSDKLCWNKRCPHKFVGTDYYLYFRGGGGGWGVPCGAVNRKIPLESWGTYIWSPFLFQWISHLNTSPKKKSRQDWVAFMSQPYCVEDKVEVELRLILRLRLIGADVEVRLVWGWVKICCIWVEVELSWG